MADDRQNNPNQNGSNLHNDDKDANGRRTIESFALERQIRMQCQEDVMCKGLTRGSWWVSIIVEDGRKLVVRVMSVG
jgi:hypothetical protein